MLSGPPILSLIHGRQLTDPNPGAHWRFVVTLDGSWKSVSSDKYVTKKTQSVKKKRFVQHKYWTATTLKKLQQFRFQSQIHENKQRKQHTELILQVAKVALYNSTCQWINSESWRAHNPMRSVTARWIHASREALGCKEEDELQRELVPNTRIGGVWNGRMC